MGFWSKFGKNVVKGADWVRAIAPIAPIPPKAKAVIEKSGAVEDDIKAVVDEIKRKPPAA